jgi:hypothetical protein
MAGNFDLHTALANGDPQALASCKIAPSIAKMAAQARTERLARAPAAPKSVAPTPVALAALPSLPFSRNTPVPASLENASASRAAQVAEVHLAAINASRKKCGLALLTASELAREFADLDRPPPRATVGSPRTNPQAAVGSMWGGIVAQLNTTVPARAKPIGLSSERVGSSATSLGKSSNRAVDWGAIAGELNTTAGLKSPSRSL